MAKQPSQITAVRGIRVKSPAWAVGVDRVPSVRGDVGVVSRATAQRVLAGDVEQLEFDAKRREFYVNWTLRRPSARN